LRSATSDRVSLTAYNDYVSANEEAEAQDALNRHVTGGSAALVMKVPWVTCP
jgi:hypothetical protein